MAAKKPDYNYQVNATAYDGTKIKIQTTTKIQARHCKEWLDSIWEGKKEGAITRQRKKYTCRLKKL